MASVYEKRGTWYANFKDATGRRRNVATKTTTKTEARRLAADLERQGERPPVRAGAAAVRFDAHPRAVVLVVAG